MTTLLRVHASLWWDLLMVCHHRHKPYDHNHYDSGNIMFLICNIILREYILKGLCEFMAAGSSRRVTNLPDGNLKYLTYSLDFIASWLFMACHHPVKLGGHRYFGSRDIIVFSLSRNKARPRN